MINWGINALNHGSSLTVFKDGEFISNTVNSAEELDSQTIVQALHVGAPDRIFWYEKPWLKKLRQAKAGQWDQVFDYKILPQTYLNRTRLHYAPVTYTPHHGSHAAAGYYTSPFNHCAVVVLDAIGEFECGTIWNCQHDKMTKVWSRSYPHSLGLFYSAFTKLLGLTPIKDEFVLQQMSAKGDPNRFRKDIGHYFGSETLTMEYNFHRGVLNWPNTPIDIQEQYDIAAAVQERFEIEVAAVMTKAQQLTKADCLVYMGGCAMNSQANAKEVEPRFKYRWTLPNPGDPSSSIGAVLYHTQQRVWNKDFGVVKHLKVSV
jgi:carbamoyltransferase